MTMMEKAQEQGEDKAGAKMKQIQPITIELIKELRLNGNRVAATRMMEEFHNQLKLNKMRAYKEILSVDRKKTWAIKKSLGICGREGCENKTSFGHAVCEECLEKKRKKYSVVGSLLKILHTHQIFIGEQKSGSNRVYCHVCVTNTGEVIEE